MLDGANLVAHTGKVEQAVFGRLLAIVIQVSSSDDAVGRRVID